MDRPDHRGRWRQAAGALRAAWRRHLPWAGGARAAAHFVYNPRYELELPQVHLDPQRGRRILEFLDDEGLVGRRTVHRARRLPLAALARVHDPAYLQTLQEPAALARIIGFELPDPLQDAFLACQRAMAGGTLLAARLALSRRTTVVNLGGGLHHARRDRGGGLCAFNDVAAAVAALRAEGWSEQAIVIDLDLHDGDGTRAIFAADPSVHTFSIHNRDLDDAPAVASTSIALGSGVEDAAYLEAVAAHLPPLLDQGRPGLVFYLAGVDPAADDRLGDWRISAAGLLERDRLVMREVRARFPRLPLVILLAGGYGAHAWRHNARFLSSLLSGGRVHQPPPTSAATLSSYRRLAKLLRLPELSVEPGSDGWTLGAADLDPAGGRVSTRFLDVYSRHGVELALERFGLLDRLRARGFPNLTVDFDLHDRRGHTLRIQSVGDTLHTLIEFRLRRDRGTVPGRELLSVEWLLSQDPRLPFAPDRPPLAGQEHPGLGLMRDFAAVLSLICEQLRLDGVVFVPSHYHIAAHIDIPFGFLAPPAEARMRALRHVLAGLSVAEASRALAEGRVWDRAAGRAAVWEPSPAVVPASSGLRAWLAAAAYSEQVAAAMRGLDYELRPAGGRGGRG